MTDKKELEVAFIRADCSKEKAAEVLGLSAMGLYKKINNLTEFKASEIVALQQLLQLSDKQRDLIFFGLNKE